MIETLIAATPDIEAIQEEGYSALLIAASDGKQAWVEALTKAGADPGRRTKDGRGLDDLRPRC
jgi:ankyrin repeat protein